MINTEPVPSRALLAILLLAGCAKDQKDRKDASETPPVAAEVQASMKDFLAYTESVLAIMRQHGADCDLAAKQLESRAAVFRELGPRMMKLKAQLDALPAPERERIKGQTEQSMEAFKKRNPDAEELEQRAKACEQTSPAFAAIAPQVMLVKKK